MISLSPAPFGNGGIALSCSSYNDCYKGPQTQRRSGRQVEGVALVFSQLQKAKNTISGRCAKISDNRNGNDTPQRNSDVLAASSSPVRVPEELQFSGVKPCRSSNRNSSAGITSTTGVIVRWYIRKK